MRTLTMKMRQFGKTTMLVELAMLQFYKELKRVKCKHRTLKDVINRNRR